MHSRTRIAAVGGALISALVLTGCSGSSYVPGSTPPPGETNEPVTDDIRPAGTVVTKVVAKKLPRIGNVVTDSKGWILYRFDEDSAKPPTSNCLEDCAETWPPVLVKNRKSLPVLQGIDRKKVGVVERDEGTWQLTIGGWPMYRYTGDEKAGQWQGQGASGTWFVATKDGKKNLRLLQAGASEGSDEESSGSADEGSGGEDDGGSGGDYGGY